MASLSKPGSSREEGEAVAESNAVAEIEKGADRYIAVWNEPNA